MKKKGKATGKKVGRPTKCTPEIMQKLFDSFLIDSSIQIACEDAGISERVFYDWCKNKVGFLQEMLKAKLKLHRSARMVIAKAIAKGDVNSAKWFLEHRESDVYAPRIKQESVKVTARVITPLGDEPHPFALPAPKKQNV